MAEENKANNEVPALNKVEFHYEKNSQSRVIHVNGVIGGITPLGEIAASVYSEQFPLPDMVVQEITDSGLGREIERTTKTGVYREVQSVLMFESGIARAIALWLLKQADEAENFLAARDGNVKNPEEKGE